MKKENRFAALLRNLKNFGRRHTADESLRACMNAIIDEPGSVYECEYESFNSEYRYR